MRKNLSQKGIHLTPEKLEKDFEEFSFAEGSRMQTTYLGMPCIEEIALAWVWSQRNPIGFCLISHKINELNLEQDQFRGVRDRKWCRINA